MLRICVTSFNCSVHLAHRRKTNVEAASAASLLLTTEALIAEKPEKKAGGGAAMPDMGDMGM